MHVIVGKTPYLMLRSHCRSDQLDHPDRPNFPTKLDQLLDRACTRFNYFGPLLNHPRPLTTPSRLQPDSQHDIYSIIPIPTPFLFDQLDQFHFY